jgi:hypothetical protein
MRFYPENIKKSFRFEAIYRAFELILKPDLGAPGSRGPITNAGSKGGTSATESRKTNPFNAFLCYALSI